MMKNGEIPNPPDRLAGVDGFKNKTLLITGGTGFMGKVLIEKILRSCPAKKIYVLVRSKKGKDPQERMIDVFSNPIFDLLKKTKGEEILKKVVAVSGDVTELGLGLSKEDRQVLVDEVEIVYHGAAAVRFDEPLKRSVLLNTRGTKLMLDLAKEMKKLLVFLHISTAYSQYKENVLYEKTYPPPADPHKIIKIVESLEEDVVEGMAKDLMGDCPNTYTFSKALGEGLVNDEMNNLPVMLLRPSVVIPVWLEPLPGWTDNINGPTGLLIAAGKGILRTMYGNPKGYADFIPVDIAVNGFLIAAYYFLNYKDQQVCNMITSFQFKMTWVDIIETGRKVINTKIPFNWVVWYPGGSMKTSRSLNNICIVLFHYIPALILDSLILLSGNKPVLWRVQQRITKGFDMFEFYVNNQWDFNNDHTMEALKRINDTEKKIYKVDGQDFDLESYLTNCLHAARLYILKESDETLPTARRHMKIMWAVDKLCKTLILIGFGYLLLQYFLLPVFDLFFSF